MMGKAKWKSLEKPLPRKRVYQNQYHIPGEIAEISATIKDLKGDHSYHIFIILLFGLCRDR